MYTIIVTGGLGSGKTTAAEYFAERGATVICADDLAHQVLSKGSMTLEEVAREFGDDILYADGSLDRPALARAAFDSKAATERLNEIVHPAVYLRTLAALRDLRLSPVPPDVVVLEVPLLVEAPQLVELADEVVAIVAPEHVRLERAKARGMSEPDAYRRLHHQATDAERAQLADVVIANSGDMAAFEEQLRQYWDTRIAHRIHES